MKFNFKRSFFLLLIFTILFLSLGSISATDSSLDDVDSINVVDYQDSVELSDSSVDLISDSSSDLIVNDSAESYETGQDITYLDDGLESGDVSELGNNDGLESGDVSDVNNKEETNIDEKKLNAYRYAYFDIDTYDFDYGDTAYIGVRLTYSGSYLYKYISVSIWSDDGYSDTQYVYTSSSGTKNVYFYNLDPGTYYVQASFDGDSTYYSRTSSTYSFTVTGSKEMTYPSFSISVEDISYGSTAYVYTSLTNSYGTYLNKYVTLHVWSNNGYDVNRTFYTSSSGSKSSSFSSLEPGTYSVRASFEGDSRYYSTNSATYSFKVTDTRTYPSFNITASDIEYGSTAYVYTSLTDNYGNYLYEYVTLHVWSNNGYDVNRTFYTSSYGSKSYSFSSLSAGTYYVQASFDGDYSYRPLNSTIKTFIVTPPKSFAYLYVYANDSVEGNSIFKISMTNEYGTPLSGKTLEVSIYNSSYSYNEHFTVKTNSYGNYSLTVKNLTPGFYYISVNFEGDSTYYSTSDSSSFTVFSKDTSIDVEASPCVVGDSAEIAIDVYDANYNRISAPVKVYIDNKFYGSLTTDADKTVYYNLDGLKDGNFLIKVSFAGNSSYRSSEGFDNLKVYKVSKINLNVSDFVYGTQGVLNVSLTDDKNNILNKNFTVRIYDDDFTYDKKYTVNGNQYIILYSYDFMEDRTYNVDVRFAGDDVYYYCFVSDEFRVLTKNTHIEFYIPHPATDENIQSYVTLYDDGYNPIAGTVTVMIDNKTYTVKTKAVEGNLLSIGKLTAGNHTVSASFIGNETYFSTNYTDTFKVYKGTVLSIKTNNILSGQTATLDFTLKGTDGKALNGELYVLLESMYDSDTKDYFVNVTNGKASLKVSGVKTNYAVYARYDGNDDYIYAKQIEFIRISLPSSLKVTASNINYGSDEVITVNLLGNNKNITDVVNVFVGNKAYNVSVANGKGTLTVKALAVGHYNIAAYYKGNNSYLASSAQASFNVNSLKTRIVYSDMVTTAVSSADGRIGKYFEVKLVDANGKALANKLVQIGFNGKIYNKTTDSSGNTKLQINLPKAGLYTFAVAFLGDSSYSGSFVVAKITVNRQTPKLTSVSKTFKNTTKSKALSATFKTSHGKAVKGMSIVFIINGKLYSAKTNSKGVATVKVSLNKKGTYTCTIRSVETNSFKAVSIKSKVYVK